jgi:hypothetical protein
MIEFGEQTDTARSSIEQSHAGNRRLVLQLAEDVNADTFISHQNIAHSEHQDGIGGVLIGGGGVRLADQGGVEQRRHRDYLPLTGFTVVRVAGSGDGVRVIVADSPVAFSASA